MSENFHILVTIKLELTSALIFNLKARPPIGIVLSYVDYEHKVVPLLQSLSHATRAFIWNANGLNGFLVRFQIMKILKEADE